jgi:hypothetical protein
MLACVSLRKWRILALENEILSCFPLRCSWNRFINHMPAWFFLYMQAYKSKGFLLSYRCWQGYIKWVLNTCQIPAQNCRWHVKDVMIQKHTMIRWVNGPLASNHIQQLQFFSMEVKVVREFLSGLGQDIYSNKVGQTLLANQGCRLNHV